MQFQPGCFSESLLLHEAARVARFYFIHLNWFQIRRHRNLKTSFDIQSKCAFNTRPSCSQSSFYTHLGFYRETVMMNFSDTYASQCYLISANDTEKALLLHRYPIKRL